MGRVAETYWRPGTGGDVSRSKGRACWGGIMQRSTLGESKIPADTLIRQAREGSASALDQLIELLAEYLWAELGARRKPRGLGPSHGLSDLIQDTLVRTREKFDRFSRDTFTDLKQWARTILHRRWQECVRNYRTRNREELRRKIWLAVEARLIADPAMRGQDQIAESRQEAERAALAFARLRPHERTILTLRILEDLSYPQIATLTGLSSEAARTTYRRAIARLQQVFDSDASKPTAPG